MVNEGLTVKFGYVPPVIRAPGGNLKMMFWVAVSRAGVFRVICDALSTLAISVPWMMLVPMLGGLPVVASRPGHSADVEDSTVTIADPAVVVPVICAI